MTQTGAAWLGRVPPMFRSAAESVERHRARLDGDPASLRATAAHWRRQATQPEAAWHDLEDGRSALAVGWHGEAATASDARATALAGELATSASSLAFAADGLDLAAAAVQRGLARANAQVEWYATALDQLYRWALAAPPAARPRAVAELVRRGGELGRQALHAVYAEEVALDHVLASMPRRFVVGPPSPWRSTLKGLTDTSVDGQFGAALTISGVRTTSRDGTYVTTGQDGKVVVGFTRAYALGGHMSWGAKVAFDRLPKTVRDALVRRYGEVEGAGVLSYSLRYQFRDAAAAQAFLDRLQDDGVGGRSLAGLRKGATYVLGPIADARLAAVAGQPDEVTFALGGYAKANADAGTWPVGGVNGTAGADTAGTLTVKRSGDSSLAFSSSGNAMVGGTLLGHSAVLGGAEGVTRKVDYDSTGQPVRYTTQGMVSGDLDYRSGTAGGYAGFGRTPLAQLPKGVHVKSDTVGSTRVLTGQVLDLRRPAARAAFDRAWSRDPAAVVPDALTDPQLQRYLDDHGTLVVQKVGVDRTATEASATVGMGPETLGVKGGSQREHQRVLDAWYVDLSSPHARDAHGALQWRPYPRDVEGPRWETPRDR